MASWPLRLRLGLLFAGFAAAALAVLALALWVAALILGTQANARSAEALTIAALIGGFGLTALAVGLWWLMDSRIARPVQRLSSVMRAHAAGGHGPLDHAQLRALGDLGPAAELLTAKLRQTQDNAAQEMAQHTEALAQDREKLAAILSDIPLGVLMLDAHRRITIYDEQAQHAFGADAPLVLGRDAAQYFDPEPLESALAALADAPKQGAINAALPLSRSGLVVDAKLRKLSDGSGALLTFEVDATGLPARPVVFDFALTGQPPSLAEGQTRLAELSYVVFDTETTGLDPSRDAVVQIGAVRMRGTKIIHSETFDMLVDPGRPIPAFSTRVHGIADADVAGAPGFAEAGRRFCDFAQDAVIVAHNAPFDLAFFDQAVDAIGTRLDAPVLDTVLLSAALFGGDEAHTLDALAERFGVHIDPAHRHTALGDALATAAVLAPMIRFAEGRGIVTLADALSAMKRHAKLLPDVVTRPANQRCVEDQTELKDVQDMA